MEQTRPSMKNILALVAGILLTIGIWTVTSAKQLSPTPPVQKEKRVETFTITQVVELPQGNLSKTTTVTQGKTALETLKDVTSVETTGEGENAFVTSIGNRRAQETNREFWAFYVNGKQAPVGAGSYQVVSGDVITWKLETY